MLSSPLVQPSPKNIDAGLRFRAPKSIGKNCRTRLDLDSFGKSLICNNLQFRNCFAQNARLGLENRRSHRSWTRITKISAERGLWHSIKAQVNKMPKNRALEPKHATFSR